MWVSLIQYSDNYYLKYVLRRTNICVAQLNHNNGTPQELYLLQRPAI